MAGEITAREGGLDPGDIHDVLQNDRRRLTLNCLREAREGSLAVSELSEQVATLETNEDPPPRNKRQSVYVSLHQTHLPKLDGLGIVRYDSDTKTVTLLDRVEEVEVYMEVVPRYGLSWGEYYFGLGLLGLVTTVAVLVGVPGVSQLGFALVSALMFVALMCSSFYHVYSQQDRVLFQRLRS